MLKLAFAVLAGTVLGVGATQMLQAQAKSPAFLISDITVTNPEAFKAWGERISPTFAQFGGKYLARGGQTMKVTGSIADGAAEARGCRHVRKSGQGQGVGQRPTWSRPHARSIAGRRSVPTLSKACRRSDARNRCSACTAQGHTFLVSSIKYWTCPKIEAGKLELNPQTVQLAPLVEEVIGTARQLAEPNKNCLIVRGRRRTSAF